MAPPTEYEELLESPGTILLDHNEAPGGSIPDDASNKNLEDTLVTNTPQRPGSLDPALSEIKLHATLIQ